MANRYGSAALSALTPGQRQAFQQYQAGQQAGYTPGDWRSGPLGVPPDVQQFAQWSQNNPEIQQILADPRYAGNTPAQRRARQAAIHQVVVANGQHIPKGLKINADGRLETDDQTGLPGWAKALIIGGGAAAAVFGIPALAGVLGGGGAEAAGAGGAGLAGGATGTAGGLLPAVATVPTSTGTIAGLSGLTAADVAATGGAAAAGGAAGASALLPSTVTVPTSSAASFLPSAATVPTATGTIAGVPSSGAVQAAMQGTPSLSSTLGGVGHWLSTPGGVAALGVGGQLAGAAIGAHGYTEAAKIQAETAAKALAYEKQRDDYLKQLEASRYSDLSSRLSPYIQTGQSASERMASLLGLPAPTASGPGVPAPSPYPTPGPAYQTRTGLDTGTTPVGTAIPRPGGPQPPSVASLLTPQANLITMKAPNGSVQQVPADQLNHWLSRGAVQVNG